MMPTDDELLRHYACELVLRRFVNCLDDRDYDALIELTDPDIVWTAEAEFRGHAAVRQRLSNRPAELRTFHILSSVVVEFASDTEANARSHLTVYANDPSQGVDSPLQLRAVALYADRLAKKGDRWLIAEKSIHPIGKW
jgi:hypothetical protein